MKYQKGEKVLYYKSRTAWRCMAKIPVTVFKDHGLNVAVILPSGKKVRVWKENLGPLVVYGPIDIKPRPSNPSIKRTYPGEIK